VKLFAVQKVAIGYDEPADLEKSEGPKLVVTYAEGEEVPTDQPIANLAGLVDQGYLRVEGTGGEEIIVAGEHLGTITDAGRMHVRATAIGHEVDGLEGS
jgi:hypothetical protein